MKGSSKIGSWLLLLVAGLVAAADYFNFPRINQLLIVLVGVVACIVGVRMILTRQAVAGQTRILDPGYIERYAGLSAWLMGVVVTLAGFVILGLGVLDLLQPGRADTFLSGLTGSPTGLGLALGFSGVIVTAFGVIRILAGSGRSPGAFGSLVEFGYKAGGVLSVLAGVLMLAVAAGLILAPGLVKELFQQGSNLVRRWILNP